MKQSILLVFWTLTCEVFSQTFDLRNLDWVDPPYIEAGDSLIGPEYQFEFVCGIEVNKVDKLELFHMFLEKYPMLGITCIVHTDSRGNSESNQELSERRAKSIRDQCIAKEVDPDRIIAVGKGESSPSISDEIINQAESAEEREALHQQNRRVQWVVFELN